MIKKLDFKFINELRRNQHIKELADAVNSNADELIENRNNVAGLLAGYSSELASTKKIYCHQITLTNSVSPTIKGRFNAFIFNNNAETIGKTNLISIMKENVRTILTGGCIDIVNSKVIIASHAYYDGDGIFVMGIQTNGAIIGIVDNIDFEEFINNTDSGLADNVYAIN